MLQNHIFPVKLSRSVTVPGTVTIDVLTMGPIGITPELKRQGYGKALLDYSLEKAAEMVRLRKN